MLAVATSTFVVREPAAAGAQPFPGSQPSPQTQNEPYLHVGATVHKLLVQAVESDGTLWLDLEGRPLRVRLEDVQLAAENTASGREARKLLGRFVGRWIRFGFQGAVAHELGQGVPPDVQTARLDVDGGDVVPTYSAITDRLLESGLARYCPGPGKVSSGLARLEEEARRRRVGIWRTGDAPACEPRSR